MNNLKKIFNFKKGKKEGKRNAKPQKTQIVEVPSWERDGYITENEYVIMPYKVDMFDDEKISIASKGLYKWESITLVDGNESSAWETLGRYVDSGYKKLGLVHDKKTRKSFFQNNKRENSHEGQPSDNSQSDDTQCSTSRGGVSKRLLVDVEQGLQYNDRFVQDQPKDKSCSRSGSKVKAKKSYKKEFKKSMSGSKSKRLYSLRINRSAKAGKMEVEELEKLVRERLDSLLVIDTRNIQQYTKSHVLNAISLEQLKACDRGARKILGQTVRKGISQLIEEYINAVGGLVEKIVIYDDDNSGSAWKAAAICRDQLRGFTIYTLEGGYKKFYENAKSLCYVLKVNETEAGITIPSWLEERSKEKIGDMGVAATYFDKLTISERARIVKIREGTDKDDCSYSFNSGYMRIGQNRYPNVLPYDSSRVKLHVSSTNKESNDYINANYVGMEDGPQYILTQGPLQSTTPDFWQMIWEQNVNVIVMLGELTENGVEKCYAYWPAAVGVWHRFRTRDSDCVISVRMEAAADDCNCKEIVTRMFRIRASINGRVTGKARVVTQIQYLAWKDNSTPDTPRGLIRTISLANMASTSYQDQGVVSAENDSKTHPIVVHCSAGCGRSGVFAAVDTALLLKKDETPVVQGNYDPLFSIVSTFRKQRMGVVQSLDQFLFCYKAILYNLKSTDDLKYPQLDILNLSTEQKKMVIQWNRLRSNVFPPDSNNLVWIMVGLLEIAMELKILQLNHHAVNNTSRRQGIATVSNSTTASARTDVNIRDFLSMSMDSYLKYFFSHKTSQASKKEDSTIAQRLIHDNETKYNLDHITLLNPPAFKLNGKSKQKLISNPGSAGSTSLNSSGSRVGKYFPSSKALIQPFPSTNNSIKIAILDNSALEATKNTTLELDDKNPIGGLKTHLLGAKAGNNMENITSPSQHMNFKNPSASASPKPKKAPAGLSIIVGSQKIGVDNYQTNPDLISSSVKQSSVTPSYSGVNESKDFGHELSSFVKTDHSRIADEKTAVFDQSTLIPSTNPTKKADTHTHTHVYLPNREIRLSVSSIQLQTKNFTLDENNRSDVLTHSSDDSASFMRFGNVTLDSVYNFPIPPINTLDKSHADLHATTDDLDVGNGVHSNTSRSSIDINSILPVYTPGHDSSNNYKNGVSCSAPPFSSIPNPDINQFSNFGISRNNHYLDPMGTGHTLAFPLLSSTP
ncbi:Tyrosine-protein phosphatase non-receptor type 20 [Zancudomyces culisetae]|uniref:protein-tyrosine-phosphatase n=1 Tax=Zancudomyces culisetae TaxID=1213189 RepID=A0A1R1PKB0_ZANCU|nr:Tyrosine-protein phosphatase non-receptor type 20 [Zancudomyces culisetae]|eukprot:OMH81411.1 Tyrosine-protein phosphatase non-receptor type 20 [Zancudomyces culisetae]